MLFLTAVTKGSGAGVQAGISPWDYLARQGAAITGYLLGLVVPLYSSTPRARPIRYGSFGFRSSCWCSSHRAASQVHEQACGYLGGRLALLLPSSSIFPAEDVMAFRRMYLPLLAFAGSICNVCSEADLDIDSARRGFNVPVLRLGEPGASLAGSDSSECAVPTLCATGAPVEPHERSAAGTRESDESGFPAGSF